MKKKFVLTLALVLMVAVSLTAAPLVVSGEFSAGYDFEFVSTGNSVTSTGVADIDSLVAFTGDFWKVTLVDGEVPFGGEMTAEAEIYLDKALAEQGVDMGVIALTLNVGTGVSTTVPSVFDDDDQAAYSAGLGMTATHNFGLTFGYADLVTVYASVDPTTDPVPMLIGATVNVVDGVSVAAGYTTTGNGVTGSANVDVAALAGIADVSLVASLEDIYMIDDATNEMNAQVIAGYAGFGAWFAYQLDTASASNLAASVSYATVISDVSLSASVTMMDLTDLETIDIAAGANYSMGGVKYALDTEYVLASKTFTVSPSVTIVF